MASLVDFTNQETMQMLPFKERRTTVAVTLSDSSITPVDIQKILEAGANVVKFQLSQTSKGDRLLLLGKVDRASLKCCMKYGVSTWPIATCIDLKTCIVKTGLLKEAVGSITIKEGSQITLTNNISEYNNCTDQRIFVDNSYLISEAKIGKEINIAQEEIILKCTEIIDDKSVKCIVTKGGQLASLDVVAIRGVQRHSPSLSKIDFHLIKFALEYQLDMLVVHYVRRAETLKTIKKFIGNKIKRPFLISGICTQEGLSNFDEIAKESDAILLPRDYMPYELEISNQHKLAVIQKWLGAKCLTFGKPYFISGGVFQDTLLRGEYSDREMSDVANGLLDGASGFILKNYRDTDFVVEAVKSMNELCRGMEPYTNTKTGFWRIIEEVRMPLNAAEACMLASVFTAYQAHARVIVIPTVTGSTARALLRMTPECLVITVSTKTRVTRMLNAFRCIVPLIYTNPHAKSWQLNVEERVYFAVEYAVKRSWLTYGDMYVTLQRDTEESSYCDTVRVWTTTIAKKALVECD